MYERRTSLLADFNIVEKKDEKKNVTVESYTMLRNDTIMYSLL